MPEGPGRRVPGAGQRGSSLLHGECPGVPGNLLAEAILRRPAFDRELLHDGRLRSDAVAGRFAMTPRWKSLIPRPVRRFARDVADRLPFDVTRRYPRPFFPGEAERIRYQERYVRFDLRPGDMVVDIGSGGDPFPHATVLVERFLDPSRRRAAGLQRAGKPIVMADIHALPFPDQSFEFVYCSHVLEHVEDP